MAKLYTPKKNETATMKPKPETIQFLLNYSKALNYIDCKTVKAEIILN